MSYENRLSYEVWGREALFTDPLSRGGEKLSYPIPTYQSLIGISESIYWKPTFIYVIDKLRVLNEIRISSKAVRPFDKRLALDHNTLAYYSYLYDVRYQVECHIEWNMQRPDLEKDRNLNKHLAIFHRSVKAGGRRDIFLGTRECQGYVKQVPFESGNGSYDHLATYPFDLMFHGYNYPNETGDNLFAVRFTKPVMQHGVIQFERPEDCKVVRPLRHIKAVGGHDEQHFETVDELYERLQGGDLS
jgi:CRISPR-associated protein Cas5d